MSDKLRQCFVCLIVPEVMECVVCHTTVSGHLSCTLPCMLCAHCADAEGGVAAGCSVSPLESKKCGCWWWRVPAVSVPSPTRDIEQHNLATAQSRENFPGDSQLRLSFLATDLVVRPQTSTDKYITKTLYFICSNTE